MISPLCHGGGESARFAVGKCHLAYAQSPVMRASLPVLIVSCGDSIIELSENVIAR